MNGLLFNEFVRIKKKLESFVLVTNLSNKKPFEQNFRRNFNLQSASLYFEFDAIFENLRKFEFFVF